MNVINSFECQFGECYPDEHHSFECYSAKCPTECHLHVSSAVILLNVILMNNKLLNVIPMYAILLNVILLIYFNKKGLLNSVFIIYYIFPMSSV
jgi:hypothetical protein